jgi:hypothetical protein
LREKYGIQNVVDAGGKDEDGKTDLFPAKLARIAMQYADNGWPDEWTFRKPNGEDPPEYDDDLLSDLEYRRFGWSAAREATEWSKVRPEWRLDNVLHSRRKQYKARVSPPGSRERVKAMQENPVLYRRNMVEAANRLDLSFHDGQLMGPGEIKDSEARKARRLARH